jgi:N-methylhydantoinase A
MENGAMRVGPHSAGSIPGPACYGRGGTEPTVTDANLFLGRLGEKSLLGGEMSLDRAAATQAIERLAPEAGLEPVAFAEGILSISNAAMADAMRTITISQGVDPREFALVAFGGAGPMAAVFLAEELGIGEVVVPKFPGTFSAWGMLQTDLRHDFTKSFFRAADNSRGDDLESVFVALESDGDAAIVAEGIDQSAISFQRSADMRYVGQEYTINVPIDGTDTDTTIAAFHAAHDRRYGHSSPGAPVEFVNLRVAAFGGLMKYNNAPEENAGEAPQLGERDIVFAGKTIATSIVARDGLDADFSTTGPLIIEEQSATTVVPPGWGVSVDELGSIVLTKEATQ